MTAMAHFGKDELPLFGWTDAPEPFGSCVDEGEGDMDVVTVAVREDSEAAEAEDADAAEAEDMDETTASRNVVSLGMAEPLVRLYEWRG